MSALFEAYLSGEAAPWFGAHFTDPADRAVAVRRARRPLLPAVADALEAQNARLAPSPTRDANLAALRAGAAAVVTGQQVGLFLGPLYTVYKAASAVSVARALAAETGTAVVPLFWLQSEDHDLPEIASCHVPRRGDTLAVGVPSAAVERVSIAHRALPNEVGDCLNELGAALAGLPDANPHLARLARHYRAGAGWVAAFAGLLAELFAADGLLLIDPRDPALAAVAAPVHRRAIIESAPIAAALEERVRALAAAGFSAPVHVRPGAPLSFVHPEGPAAPRYRIEPSANGFAEVGGTGVHARESLLAALADEPLRFSTSALQRPILQDTLLPTAAYVGGPGEIAYFAQLPPLYAAYDLPMPLLVPRARFRVIDGATRRLLSRLGLEPADAARPDMELLAAADDPAAFDGAAFERALLAPFEAELDAARRRLDRSAPGLDSAVEKTRATVARAVSRLSAKVAGARAHRDGERIDAVRALRARLYPNGVPQERVHGLPYYAARFGEQAFLARVRGALQPFDPTPRDLEWNDD